tara:strand:+ start:470 stop:787 length:318 start_codon:yes stop_codon:yes gene_type:complete
MNKTKTNTDFELVTLLNEIHEQMMMMTSWLERLQPVKLDVEELPDQVVLDPNILPTYPITVDLDRKDEMYNKTNLFRLDNEMIDEDQTSRSILKDLRKVIKHLEQ